MKRNVFVSFVVLVCLFALFSCNQRQRAIDNLSDLVEKVEKNASEYTEEEWTEVNQQYDEIIAEIEKYDYSSKDSERISKLKGKYAGIKTRNTISKFVDNIDKTAKEVKGAIEGFADGLTGGNDSDKK